MAFQRAYFPMNIIKLGQGYGKKASTHKYSYALDLSGTYKLFAPFDCKVSKLYVPKKKNSKGIKEPDTSHSFEVWLTSTKKVLCANGYYGYITVSLTHPYDIANMKLGKRFKQFDDLGISTKKMTGTSTGNHCHLEVSKGTSVGWDEMIAKKHGQYVNVNRVKPEQYLFVVADGKITDNEYKGTHYKFLKEKDITYKVKGVKKPPLNIRTKPLVGKVIGGLKNGDEVLKFNDKAYIYHYGILGYTSGKYLSK